MQTGAYRNEEDTGGVPTSTYEWAATWGSTPAERAATYPAHGLLPDADLTLHRAVDVAAPPPVVFRRLCQLRVAPYSYDLVDNFGRRSPRALTPGLEHLAIGQRFMTIFELAAFEPDRSITLWLRRGQRLFGRLAVTYEVGEQPGGSRLVAVLVVRLPWRPWAFASTPALVYGDALMMRKQLRTLAALAEGDARAGRAP